MGVTAYTGPLVVFGLTRTSTGQVQEYNEERGPSVIDLGIALADPRYEFGYMPGSPPGTQIKAFGRGEARVDYVYAAASTNAIATSQQAVSGTALTLTAGSGVTSTTIIAPESGTETGTLLCIGSTASVLAFGDEGTVALWNPAAGTGRCISITTSSSGDGGNWVVAGRDMYGVKITEQVLTTGASATVATRKAFKYVSAVYACTTVASTGVIVGFNETFGLPIKATYSGIDTQIRLIATSSLVGQNSSGPITVADTATATSSTGDVRGTYASTLTSTGNIRLQIVQNITPNMLASVTASDVSAIFGVTQYSSI